ncbi:MAG: hypothetical protein ACREX4_14525 [Gammaproteobacteria bacterium]
MTLGSLSIGMLILLQGSIRGPGLMWERQPVHPGCIQGLTAGFADSHPVVAAVDLEGCRRSNRYSLTPEVDGGVLRWRDPATEGGGYFQYEYLGVLTSGVHVVLVGESGGGSGVFQSLVFMRIRASQVLEDGQVRKRDTLELVGSETLGDRAEVKVNLNGDTVTIRRREFRGAAGLGPEQTIKRVVK